MPGNRDAAPSLPQNSNKRWAILGLAFVMFTLLGIYYSWSIFMTPLEKEFGWTRAQTSTPFSICLPAFCLGGLLAGVLGSVWQHRYSVCLGAVMIGIGLLLASQADRLWQMYFGYGVLVGVGIGTAYTAALSTMLKWFPDRLGLASGLLMTGYGLGGMLLTATGTALISAYGWRTTMLIFGGVISLIVFTGAFFIVSPKHNDYFPQNSPNDKTVGEKGLELTPRQMLQRKSFRVYFLWVLLLYSYGLMLMGHAVPLVAEMGATAELAALVAGLIAICNSFGRLLCGIMLDRFGRKPVMVCICCNFIVAALILFLALRFNSILLIAAAFTVAGLAYGATAACNAAIPRIFYGIKNYAMNFSVINFNLLFAALLGPHLAGVLHVQIGSYIAVTPALIVFACLALLAAVKLKQP